MEHFFQSVGLCYVFNHSPLGIHGKIEQLKYFERDNRFKSISVLSYTYK